MHIPVLKQEVIEALAVKAGAWYIDGTFGRGGHTSEVLALGGNVVAFDMDESAHEYASQNFSQAIESGQLRMARANFAQLGAELEKLNFSRHTFAGSMFDLGMSSNQIDESGRGFTFQRDEPLDMRMDENQGVTAADLLNALPEKHLKSMFWENSQESFASIIAREIVKRREKKPWRTTQELADLIEKVKRGRKAGHIHPATKVFQALRMAVNTELDNLTVLLDQLPAWMAPESRVVFLAFHEGEDRQVKQTFNMWQKQGRALQITKKPVMATDEELRANPRSRSAKMRAIEMI
jgi:16S rRNA (cytosine1402-N4)-methyltransferase